jgi:hypothetical protein
VPAGQGRLEQYYERWTVRHLEGCPPYPGGYTGPVWTISHGVARGFHPIPEGGYNIGQVLRATVGEYRDPVAAGAPGRSITRGGVSAVVTVLAELEPQYCRDEDGDNPSDLIGEDGWLFTARVRMATAQEAAPLLAAESEQRHIAELRGRCRRLILHASDGEIPPEQDVDLSGAVRVPWGEELDRIPGYHRPDEIHLDQSAGVVWSLRYNGADGDMAPGSTSVPPLPRSCRRPPSRPWTWSPPAAATASTARCGSEEYTLTRQTFTVPGGSAELWQIRQVGAAMGDEDGDSWDLRDLYAAEGDALQAWRRACTH